MQSHDATIDIWGTNGTLALRSVKLELHFVDLKSSWSHTESHDVALLPNQTTELLSIRCPGPPKEGLSPPSGDPVWTTTYSVVASARLIDTKSGEVLARFADWPQPYRFVEIPDPGLQVTVNGESVTVNVRRPVKGLFFTVDGPDDAVKFSDNALDVVPRDTQTIMARGLGGRGLKVAYLGKEKAFSVAI